MFRLALRNVLRNKRRSFLTGLSIAFAVMMVIFLWTFVSGIIDNLFNSYVTNSVGHIRVMNMDYLKRESMLPLSATVYDYQQVMKKLEEDPNVTLVTSRIKFGVLMDIRGKNKPVLGIGIDPARERSVLDLQDKMVAGRMFTAGTSETVVGLGLAKDLGLKAGDTLTVITQTAHGSLSGLNLKVDGIFSLGVASVDNRTFFLPLGQAQQLLDLDNRVTEIFLLIKDSDKAEEVAAELNKKLPSGLTAVPWQANGFLYFMMAIVRYIYGVIYAFILILASFTILNTMFMAVMERTREIGMMKALGMREGALGRLIILEALILGVLASFIGAIGGTLLAYYVSTVGIDYTAAFQQIRDIEIPLGYIYKGQFSWLTIGTGFVMGIIFSVLASVFPARRAAKMEPTEAMKAA
ncbi:MAG: FtsX-like permease family protein [Candidatus Margulisbacteria bacterium]|nr:FtsX-like permease family protein [Candidatus Margulisiibacteriota bacterium]